MDYTTVNVTHGVTSQLSRLFFDNFLVFVSLNNIKELTLKDTSWLWSWMPKLLDLSWQMMLWHLEVVLAVLLKLDSSWSNVLKGKYWREEKNVECQNVRNFPYTVRILWSRQPNLVPFYLYNRIFECPENIRNDGFPDVCWPSSAM